MMQVWGTLIIFIVCPLLGGLPLIAWITFALTRRNLARIGTGNIGVQAAFYHGGTLVGILAVLSEAFKGIAAVLLARVFFPNNPTWELIALIALVMGRYWMGKGAGTTNVVWGYVVHDPKVALLVFLIGGIGFTIVRDRQSGRLWILILCPLILAMLYPREVERIVVAIALSILLGWIYQKIPDDLDLPTAESQPNSQKLFRFFRGDKAMISLQQPLDAVKVGQKAATLSQLKRWGYPVPPGWVLPPGDDPEPLIESLQPSPQAPLVVRSSAIGEDSQQASAAGQYQTILNVTSKEALQEAINQCQISYNAPAAVEYRQQLNVPEAAMAVLIQTQVQGAFSGVAFSRDPIIQYGDAVVIEALPGSASLVVSGQVTPENYRVVVSDADIVSSSWVLPENLNLQIEGEGEIPPGIIRQVAYLARHLEARYHGIPQDIEWSYDGQTLWLLQSRPITNLSPIWTRKIAAEVIPGLIRPLTWSINRPLTCGVWGELFTLVLGKRARGLDFNETATLHYSRAYFNASLLGQIFRRMGLPPESLEFLTRGAKFSKPPLLSTLQNLPGLLRLLQREISLPKDFQQDYKKYFAPGLAELKSPSVANNANSLLERIDLILEFLKKATYYSILSPLSLALRQGIFQVKDKELDAKEMPELAALRELQELAATVRNILPNLEQGSRGESQIQNSSMLSNSVLLVLDETPEGKSVLDQFDRFLERYGYLSEVGTDIAVPTWKEDPSPVRELFAQFIFNPPPISPPPARQSSKAKSIQKRLNLKGRVTSIYSQLLAELRWSFVAIEKLWLQSGLLSEPGDIFFLEFSEIRRIVEANDRTLIQRLPGLIRARQSQLEQDSQLTTVPFVFYGNEPPPPSNVSDRTSTQQLQGIGASPGIAEGRVKILHNWQTFSEIDRNTIIVVPYTDSGWAPLLARAGGLIAEVGGRLSHGAIVAREYGIPAVMDVANATHILPEGQRVRIDGSRGTVEIL
ncbi:glycerol-3-phosphate acyltransferase [Microseira wollei]|uniref:Pyruvate phosphate dikinase, PEP/pyruvate-binding protein n=1 Tax=Microseira wollei NIES-4236 TaxID=2530354 RepID=A0AAV3XDV9_9CYAN|nr:glycerol-3-phosphate acyltransferase [Microseira wollei]GET38624.1 pyruvate phosphate dikinase, PEP/pyruvate-binding protein [Microseira wollei NIES-4236]